MHFGIVATLADISSGRYQRTTRSLHPSIVARPQFITHIPSVVSFLLKGYVNLNLRQSDQ